jgi:hypothetical protein
MSITEETVPEVWLSVIEEFYLLAREKWLKRGSSLADLNVMHNG